MAALEEEDLSLALLRRDVLGSGEVSAAEADCETGGKGQLELSCPTTSKLTDEGDDDANVAPLVPYVVVERSVDVVVAVDERRTGNRADRRANAVESCSILVARP